MRPYRLRIRLSSRRLNVTRLCWGPAAAVRAAARFSLGSASSDIELMKRLLSSGLHDCANRRTLQEALLQIPPQARPIVPTLEIRKYRVTGSLAESYCCPTSAHRPPRCLARRESCVGPVLSVPDSSAPSPPGPSGSGLFAGEPNPRTGPTKVGPFLFGACFIACASDAPVKDGDRHSGACAARAMMCNSASENPQPRYDNEYG